MLMLTNIVRAVVCLLLVGAATAAADEIVLFDFERPGLGAKWSAFGKLRAAREPVEEAPPQAEIPPAGHAVTIATDGNGGLFAKSGAIPGDWRAYGELRFWLYCPQPGGNGDAVPPPPELEVQLVERDGRARFWRKVVVDHTGWKRYSLPLKWMRWGEGRIPQWDRADRLGFWFRSAAEVSIDNISVVTDESPRPAQWSDDDVLRLAFPGNPAEEVRIERRQHVTLLTDAAELRTAELADHLERVAAEVFRQLDFLPPAEEPARLIVFSTRDAYREFPHRLATQLGGSAEAPQSSGFTVRGIATSYWDEKFGTLRPVYTHEFVHALLTPALRLRNKSEWLHEGLAVHFQLQFHPQPNMGDIVRNGIGDPRAHSPLEELCNGRPIPPTRYWQAMTVAELLLLDDDFHDRRLRLVRGMQSAGSTQLQPHLNELGVDNWKQLTEQWISRCRDEYAADLK